ncbi:DUF6682 family protein [Photobacterium damselae]|uniref:phage adaptor protein n=1 Tax=Photobacterium damselae TaxID=38293 RepID=UPI001F3D2DF2|nr:DUF6682 family protein [Photobacterium damselae]UKA12930.1 hypothetical protein IHC91_21330 [Photobacterium damselae subsp. damselae]
MTTVKNILDSVALILEDPAGDVWSKTELTAWLNDAVLAVVNRRPELAAKYSVFTTVNGARQTLPQDGFRLIRVEHNDFSYSAINEIPMSLIDRQIPQWRMPVNAVDIELYCYDLTDPLTFYVYPAPTKGLSIWITYAAKPTELVNDADLIPLTDDFKNAVIDWVLYRCYSKDDQSANAQRATMHLQAFENGIGKKTQIDASIVPDMAAGVGAGGQQ